jgi:hypothetical protein
MIYLKTALKYFASYVCTSHYLIGKNSRFFNASRSAG